MTGPLEEIVRISIAIAAVVAVFYWRRKDAS
jgi:hypothetical protein